MTLSASFKQGRAVSALVIGEPMTRIEPAYSAWEAFSTPERVSENVEVDGLPDR